MARLLLVLAALGGFTGVALGAFAAHGLKARLSPEYLAVFQTGTHYQLIHSLALLAVELNLEIVPRSLHATTHLAEGDRVEVVHAIGGG